MKNDGKLLNKKQNENENLYRVEFTPKGESEKISLYIYAKNRLDASNYLIHNRIYGKQHLIEACSVNLLG